MISLSSRVNKQSAMKNTDYIASKILSLRNLYRLNFLGPSAQLKYSKIKTYDSRKKLANIFLALFSLKIIYFYQGRTISLTSNDFLSRFTESLPLLPYNAIT